MKKAILILTILFSVSVITQVGAATVVAVDATSLGVADGTSITSLSNSGTAGDFSTSIGTVTAASHPSNNNAAVSIQGAAFSSSKMISTNSQATTGLTGNAPYTVRAWVWNEAFGNEEAHLSWGHRGGPLGSNAGFHQGVHPTFGAIGHWGGGAVGDPNEPDVGWGPPGVGTEILGTEARWANLAYVYDGTTDFVYIDGMLSASEAHPNGLDYHTTFNDGSDTFIALGSESDAGNNNSAPIPFSGTIARSEVFDTAMSDAQILASFNAEKPLFFDGIPEPSSAILALLGFLGLTIRRRR
jgi:hypothetical protein